jgi:hypothetical protein
MCNSLHPRRSCSWRPWPHMHGCVHMRAACSRGLADKKAHAPALEASTDHKRKEGRRGGRGFTATAEAYPCDDGRNTVEETKGQ